MLNRYLQSKKEPRRDERRRPYLSTLCDDVEEAEKWRLQVLRDIRRRIEEIHNPGLDDTQARELNDNINKLLRERSHWERRIVQLHGTDHARQRRENGKDDFSKGVFKHNGFFYFGSARNLPGVKDIIERERTAKHSVESFSMGETPATLLRRVDDAYFGHDVLDSDLRVEENEAEEKLREEMVRAWEEKGGSRVDSDWDESYLEFIGNKPVISAEAEMNALALERRKVDVLEHLDTAARAKR